MGDESRQELSVKRRVKSARGEGEIKISKVLLRVQQMRVEGG